MMRDRVGIAHASATHEQSLRDAHRTFAEREAAAMRDVVEWRCGRAPRTSLLPLHDERAHPHARAGRQLGKRVAPRDGVVEYGYDTNARIRIVREHAMRGQKGLLHQLVLVEHDADAIRWSVHHESAGRGVREVGIVFLDGGAPVGARVVTRHVVTEERYTRDEHGRIVGIEVRHEHDWAQRERARLSTTLFTVDRDQDGEIVRVEWDDGHARGTTYQRPRSEGYDVAADALVEALVRATLRLASRPDDAEPAFAIAITWSGAQPLPPLVALGLTSDRTRLATNDASLWAPVEWATTLPVHEDPQVRALSAELLSASAPLRVISGALRRAAAKLRKTDLGRRLPTTDDFVVLAVDWEGRSLSRALHDARHGETKARS